MLNEVVASSGDAGADYLEALGLRVVHCRRTHFSTAQGHEGVPKLACENRAEVSVDRGGEAMVPENVIEVRVGESGRWKLFHVIATDGN
eukprot:2259117-Rhodomonas_salina.2